MKAGFAKVRITPPIGTAMMGFGSRDRQCGCEGVHDDIFVRALYLTHEKEEVLIMGFDLCFLGREEADRYKGAIGRKIDFSPRQILLNTSHTHVGPSVGTWGYADYKPPERLYLRELESATVAAACQAKENAREVTLWAGTGKSSLPMNRRRRDKNGNMAMLPNPDGVVCDLLPVCLLKDMDGKPVSLLFSVSCHPSTISGFDISAEYPGVAMDILDAYLGATGSLFLQGTGGDAKPCVIGKGEERWRAGTWEDVTHAGTMVAQEAIDIIETGLEPMEPEIRSAAVEMYWPLAPIPSRSWYEAVVANLGGSGMAKELMQLWAERQIERLDRGENLPTSVPITCHGVQLARGLHLIGLEGEAVAELGLLILAFYRQGITFPLGYTNGGQLYLPTEAMLDEGGYEVVSYFEYGHPAPLAKGFEKILRQSLEQLYCANNVVVK
ncbi:hypothetical protein FJZ31_04370 [Candidatus Poribacteria bacterium]|nr:hypothetical protein [Candidatus Poribacteria bacterium]